MKRWIGAVLGMAALACAAGEPLRIGLIAPLTGSSADFGLSMLHGAQMAVAEINDLGGFLGRPFELVVRDDRADPATGRAAALDLVTRAGVGVTLGFCNTGVALAALDVFESHGQVLLVPCAQGTAVTHRRPAAASMVFRLAPSDAINARFLVGEIVERRGLARVAILADTTGYGDGGVADIRAQLARRGLVPAYVGRFALEAASLVPQMQAARAAGAQAVIVYTVGPQEGLAARARAALHWNVPFFAPWTLSFRSALQAAGAAALEGTMMTQTIIQDAANDRRAAFVAQYFRRFDERPIGSLMAAAQAYDAVNLLMHALFATRGSLEGAVLKAALENPSEPYRGVVTTYVRPFSAQDHDAYSVNMVWLGVWHAGGIHYLYADDARLSAAVRRKDP